MNAPHQKPPHPDAPAVTPRAVCIGITCAPFFCAITPCNDFAIAATCISGTQFPNAAIFGLLVFVAPVNVVLRRFAPRHAFGRGGLLTIRSAISAGSIQFWPASRRLPPRIRLRDALALVSIFLGWVSKAFINRCGGMMSCVSFLPHFLGLILGDAVNSDLRILIGCLTRVGYQIMPT